MKGKVYQNGSMIRNDTLLYYDYRPEMKLKAIIDSDGNYSIDVFVMGPCPSGLNCKGMTKDECFYERSKNLNIDSLVFLYKNQVVKVKNKYLEVLRASKEYQHIPEYLEDINF